MRPWRLLIDEARDAAWNMALDEALLAERAAQPAGPVTLRLYGWCPPALSLGRSQPPGDGVARRLRDAGVDLVRRPTGGLAVLHEHERTYSVVADLNGAPFAGDVRATYRRIAPALVDALARIGVVATCRSSGPSTRPAAGRACFDRPAAQEIEVAGRKLIGSAQARRRGAFLQHGSIPLRSVPGRLGAVLGADVVESRFTDLATAAGRDVGGPEVDRALVTAFESVFGIVLEPGSPSPAEAQRATRLRASKYLDARWTLEGRAPSTSFPGEGGA